MYCTVFLRLLMQTKLILLIFYYYFYFHFRKYVGLRKVECLRPFKLKYAEKLQHDCMPIVLVMGGLQPKDPVNPNYGWFLIFCFFPYSLLCFCF